MNLEHEIAYIVRELQELHEQARQLIGAPGPRLEVCNRIESLTQKVKDLDPTPRVRT